MDLMSKMKRPSARIWATFVLVACLLPHFGWTLSPLFPPGGKGYLLKLNALPTGIKPGIYIDISITPKTSNSSLPKKMLRDVHVIAIDKVLDKNTAKYKYALVFVVTPPESEMLTAAANAGQYIAVLQVHPDSYQPKESRFPWPKPIPITVRTGSISWTVKTIDAIRSPRSASTRDLSVETIVMNNDLQPQKIRIRGFRLKDNLGHEWKTANERYNAGNLKIEPDDPTLIAGKTRKLQLYFPDVPENTGDLFLMLSDFDGNHAQSVGPFNPITIDPS
jgi:hypothetical protein